MDSEGQISKGCIVRYERQLHQGSLSKWQKRTSKEDIALVHLVPCCLKQCTEEITAEVIHHLQDKFHCKSEHDKSLWMQAILHQNRGSPTFYIQNQVTSY